eukprot:3940928-Rhodomonas_salina.1
MSGTDMTLQVLINPAICLHTAMRCPVPTRGLVLQVLMILAVCLRDPYAVSGIDEAYGATSAHSSCCDEDFLRNHSLQVGIPIPLCIRYNMPGTELLCTRYNMPCIDLLCTRYNTPGTDLLRTSLRTRCNTPGTDLACPTQHGMHGLRADPVPATVYPTWPSPFSSTPKP